MTLNSLFKTCIDIAFFLLVPVVVFFPGTVLYMLFFPQQEIINFNIPFMDDGLTIASVVFLFTFFVEFVLFFVGFYHLKKLAGLTLKKKNFFRQDVVLKLKRIGQFFSICGGSSLMLLISFKLATLSNKISFHFGFSETQLLLFLFIIGIFFLMLSTAFKKAIDYKAEKDLTI